MEEERKIRKPSKADLCARIVALEERLQKTEALVQATLGTDADADKSVLDDLGAFWHDNVVGNKRKRTEEQPSSEESEGSDERITQCVDEFLGSSDGGYVLRAKKALYVQVLKLVIYFLGHAVSTVRLGVYGHEIVMSLKPQ